MDIVKFSIHIIDKIANIENIDISSILDTCLNEFKIESVSKEDIIFTNEFEETIHIKAQGIIYTKKGNDVDKEFIEKKLGELLNKLNVKKKFKGAIELTAFSKVEESAYKESLKEVTINNKNLNRIKNITGIGIRIFNETDKYIEDFKKEPFLADNKLFYYNLTRIYNKINIDLLTLVEDLNNIYINKENEFI